MQIPVKVLLADDADVVRVAIRSLLGESPALVEIVGEAADFSQTIQLTNDLKPQVVLLDLHIARLFEPLEVKNWFSQAKLLAMSVSNDDEAKALAESYGAVALPDKMCLSDELVSAIVKTAFPQVRAATA